MLMMIVMMIVTMTVVMLQVTFVMSPECLWHKTTCVSCHRPRIPTHKRNARGRQSTQGVCTRTENNAPNTRGTAAHDATPDTTRTHKLRSRRHGVRNLWEIVTSVALPHQVHRGSTDVGLLCCLVRAHARANLYIFYANPRMHEGARTPNKCTSHESSMS